MKIFGIGTDIINIKRVEKSLKIYGNKFKENIFSKNEIAYCERKKNPSAFYAKRFAAKEALFKAIGVRNKLQFKDIEVKNNPSGSPKFNIKGNSLKNLKKIFKNKKFKIHLSLSDDKPWAIASVIIFLYR